MRQFGMQVAQPDTSELAPRRMAVTFLKNSASNAGGMVVTSLISFLMPAFLVHRLDQSTYAAWVLILNLGAYVGYFDFGVQTAVSKFVAEHDARGDNESCGQCVSTGLAIMLCGMVLGIVLSAGLALSVPTLFRKMPAAIYHDVRLSILMVGISLSVGLASSAFPAIFLGLQRYRIPAVISIISRVLYVTVLVGAVILHGSLVVMAASVAVVNVLTSLMQVVAWQRLASHVRVRLFPVDFTRLREMISYCFVLTIWSICMLFVSGVDLTIVGHYSFREAAFYSVAVSPTNFMLILVGTLMGPLLPAASALSTERTPEQMGNILLRTTRYGTVLLLLTGLPLLVGGYLALKLWVGQHYAVAAAPLLRILILANIVRQLCAPYSTMVVATARQRVATASAVTEAVVNLGASIWLARSYGAIGVAIGTLIGSFASVGMHFAVSMHFTRNLAVSRIRLFFKGILQPSLMAIPTFVLLHLWWVSGKPQMNSLEWLLWSFTTLFLMATVSLQKSDRAMVLQIIERKLK
jgi:O-antigen/teichoic acid export membrane protein